MSDENNVPTTEGVSETQPPNEAPIEAPTDFREYVKWRETGLPPSAGEAPPAAAEAQEPKQATTAPQSGAGDSQLSEEEEEREAERNGKGPSRVRKIDRLTRELEEAKLRIAAFEQRAQTPPAEQPKPQEPPGKPRLKDFQTLEEYQEALTDWKLDQREAAARQRAAESEARSAEEKIQTAWSSSEADARTRHPDYDDVVKSVKAPEGPGVMVMRQALLEEEHGAELLYHLATHPDELKRIAALTPIAAAKEVGRLSAKVLNASPSGAGNPKPQVSGAPKPPAPLSRSSGGTVREDVNDENLARDFTKWSRVREAQLKGR